MRVLLVCVLATFTTYIGAADQTSSPDATAPSKSPKEIEQELKALEAEISKFKEMLKTTKGARSELEQELEKNEKTINNTINKIDDIERDLKVGKEKIGQYSEQQNNLLVQRDKQKIQLKAQIRASYQLGNQPYLKVLLNQEDPNKLSRMLTYYDYISEARTKRIKDYNQILTELDQITEQLEYQSAKLNLDRQSLRTERGALESEQKERQATIKSLNIEITRAGTRLENSIKDQKQLEDLLARIAEGVSNLPTQIDTIAFSSRKGNLLMPVSGTIKNRYGSSRGDGKLKWDGIIITAKTGDPVHAVHYGRVVFSDWLRGFGLLLIISHGEGYMSLYGHNQVLYRETGDWVTAGEIIATVGDTGGQLESGLYFEIRNEGKPTNPQQWCKTRNRGAA
ncbi:MAG: septal ring factor EnvC (AmiA/AmiB activator) [Candidatus Azotimanducaceae bacterium]|jgi:septal ring factor EnvC (AmiA/AmiB activator)